MTAQRLYSAILSTAGLLVPSCSRAGWSAEWLSELWYVSADGNWWRTIHFCAGAFADALWMRRNRPPGEGDCANVVRTPARCLLLLATTAGLALLFFLRPYGPAAPLFAGGGQRFAPVLSHLVPFGIGLLLALALTPLSIGDIPAGRSSPAHARRFRRWIFLCLKFVLVGMLIFCGTFDLAPLLSASHLQPHAALVGYILGFRWVWNDQRRRCPVCLRILTKSASIGELSHNFLEWCGTELFCPAGHGLMHIPQVAGSHTAHRWVDLDRSWKVLFS